MHVQASKESLQLHGLVAVPVNQGVQLMAKWKGQRQEQGGTGCVLGSGCRIRMCKPIRSLINRSCIAGVMACCIMPLFAQGVNYIVPSSETGDVCAGPMDYTVTWTLGFNNDTNSTDFMVLGGIDPGYAYVRWCPYTPDDNNPYGLYCTDYGNPGVDAGDPSKGTGGG